MNIESAISHFKYGISHDIFSEPVTSYAKMAVAALEKQIPVKPVEVGKYGFGCPNCNEDLGIEKEDIYIYDMEPPKYCSDCGQKLDWKDV